MQDLTRPIVRLQSRDRQITMEGKVPDYPSVKFRVYFDADTMLGPGKADLLQGILETGSIAAAGRRMSMSYKRAWYLIDTLNSYFREPLVHSVKGGKSGGGATLTPAGHIVLETYRAMQAKLAATFEEDIARLESMMAPARQPPAPAPQDQDHE